MPAPRYSCPSSRRFSRARARPRYAPTFDDNSYLRTRLSFALWNLSEPTVPVQSYTAVVYLDREYWGLYTVSDHIDRHLMAQAGLPERGNLYKAISQAANFKIKDHRGRAKTTLHDGYVKSEGVPREGAHGAFDDLDDLIRFAATSPENPFNAELGNVIDVQDYMSWWRLVMLAAADDSAGNNSYHYHDTDTRWHVVPWDFNASFGQTWTTERRAAGEVEYYTEPNGLFERMLSTPRYGDEMLDGMARSLGAKGELAAITTLIDELAAEISQPNMDRDQARWGQAYRTFERWNQRTDMTTPAQEIEYIQRWIGERWLVLGQSF